MKIFKIGVAVFVFAFFLCALTTPHGTRAALGAEGDNSEYATYDFQKGGVQVPYLKTWKVEEQSNPSSLNLIFSPPDETNGPAKISLEIAPANGKSQDQYAQFTKDGLKQAYPDFQAKPDRAVKVGDVQAVLLEGTYTGEGGVKKQGRALLAVIDDVAYTMVYSNSEEKFSAYTKLHKYMCDNLAIGGKPNFAAAEITIGELEKTEVKDFGIALQIPKGWESGWGEGFWQAYSAADPSGHVATITLSLEEASGRDLDKVVEDGKKNLAENVPEYKEISSNTSITAGDLKGSLVIYEQAIQDGAKYRVGVGIFLKDKYVYYIFCAYDASAFNKLQPGFDKILKSFEVTGQPNLGENKEEVNKPEENKENKPETNKENKEGDEWGDDTGSSGSGGSDSGDEWGEDNGGNNANQYADLPVKVGELKKREFADYGMSLKVPSEWTNATVQNLLTISSADDGNGKIAQVILSNDTGNGRTLDKVVKDGKALFKQNISGFNVISEEPFKAGGVDGTLIIYDQDSPRGKYRVAVAIFLKDDKVYDVYCAYAVGGFDKMKPLFMEILGSFEILNANAGDNGGDNGGDSGGDSGGDYGGCD